MAEKIVAKSGAPNKRGRPRQAPEKVKIDSIIGRTAYLLVMWGFPYRQVDEIVGQVANRIHLRSDSDGLALGADRIKQFREAYQRSPSKWIGAGGAPVPHAPRQRYTKESLRDVCPNKQMSLEELADVLLTNNGEWPRPKGFGPRLPIGDRELAPKAWRKFGFRGGVIL